MELKKDGEGEEGYANCIGEKEKEFLPITKEGNLTVAEDAESHSHRRQHIHKQIHRFYFAKFRSYEETVLNMKLKMEEDEDRARITKDLQKKKLERDSIISDLRFLPCQNHFRETLGWKRREMEYYESSLDHIRHSKNSTKGRSPVEEELKQIKRLNYKMQHGSKSLVEEKKIIREIKQIEAAMEEVLIIKPNIPHHLGSEETIQGNIQRIRNEIVILRQEHLAFWAEIKLLRRKLEVAQKYIVCLERKLADINRIPDAAFKCLQLRKDEMNASFQQYLSLLKNANNLRRKKDVAALKELSNVQVEKFMSQWNNNKAFRDDYGNNVLPINTYESPVVLFWNNIKPFKE